MYQQFFSHKKYKGYRTLVRRKFTIEVYYSNNEKQHDIANECSTERRFTPSQYQQAMTYQSRRISCVIFKPLSESEIRELSKLLYDAAFISRNVYEMFSYLKIFFIYL